jgi:hypothetical protein
LYQASRWAEQLDYQLVLISNHAGNVCFELRDDSGRSKEKRKIERRGVERRKVERRNGPDF